MAFAKNEQLVICSDDYKIRKVSHEEIKRYLYQSILFYNTIRQTIGKKEENGDKRTDERSMDESPKTKKNSIFKRLFMNRKV